MSAILQMCYNDLKRWFIVRFFSSVKTFSGLLNNLGVAASMATAKLWPLASTISTGISVLGNTLDFATRDLEILESDILSGTEQLNILLEEQLEIGKITIADYHGEFPWITHLKRADILLRKRLPIFYATIDGALGCIGDALYLAANTHEDSSSSKNQDFSYSVWAGALIGLQYFVHLLITRHLTSIHQEITVLRHELDLLKDNQDFLAWKVGILERKSRAAHDKLERLLDEKRALSELQSNCQTELQQKIEALHQCVEHGKRIRNGLQNIIFNVQTKKKLIKRLENQAPTTEHLEQLNSLRSETKILKDQQDHESATLEKLKNDQATIKTERTKLRQMIKNCVTDIKNKEIEITTLGRQHEKIAKRIEDLRSYLALIERLNVAPS